jgi:lysophospholipase L1-like esterase
MASGELAFRQALANALLTPEGGLGAALAGRGLRRLIQVGTRTGMLGPGGISNGTDTQINSNTKHFVPSAASLIRIGWPSWWVNTGSSTATEMSATTNPTIKAGVSQISPVNTSAATNRAFWNAKISAAPDANGLIISDPVALRMPSSAIMAVSINVVMDSATGWYRGRGTLTGIGERAEVGTALSDKSLGGTISSGQTYGYAPLLILGVPENPNLRAVALVGDSLTQGGAGSEVADATYGWLGWPEKSLNGANPSAKFSISGFHLSGWDTRWRRMLCITQYFTDAFILLGTNDLYNNGGAPTLSLAQLQTKMTSLATELMAAGVGVVISTIPPITATSSGSTGWTAADGSDQSTSSAIEAIRLPYNAWLLANGIPGARIVDTAAVMTMAGTTGKSKAGYVMDGVHPTETGIAACAAQRLDLLFTYTS